MRRDEERREGGEEGGKKEGKKAEEREGELDFFLAAKHNTITDG